MFVIMALKNLRRRDLRPKGPDHNHGELAPRITRLAWARESKASHRVSALSGEPGPPQARSDPAKKMKGKGDKRKEYQVNTRAPNNLFCRTCGMGFHFECWNEWHGQK